MMQTGKFIVIYGANNLGKTTQADLLVKRLCKEGLETQKIKYPIYNLEPTGPIINAALREGLEMSDLELQKEFAQNRRGFEPELKKILDNGTWIVGEDYTATGIAWGATHGISLDEMEEINKGLLKEDIGILMDGERFLSGKERGHRHEDGADWEEARKKHLELAERYNWEVVNANQGVEKVSEDIWRIIESKVFS